MASGEAPISRRETFTPGQAASGKFGRVTPRAVLVALFLAVANDYWIVQLEVVRYSFPTYAVPFYNCIFTLLALTASNAWLKKRVPRWGLSRMELLTIYAMVCISSAVCSHNMMQILVSLMGYASFFQSPENDWGTLLIDHMPRWLIVSDRDSLHNFYYGYSSLYQPRNFVPWIVPALAWSAFCAVLLFTMLCMNSILRKQWVESERLTFPIVVLPLEMTEESGSFWRNRQMWMGFALAGAITLLAGLNFLYPSIPCIRIARQDIGRLFKDTPPWNAMGGIPMGFNFWAIGISFLMPLDLSFSCWLFYWITRMELVGARFLGLSDIRLLGGGFENRYPFLNAQSYGAYVGFLAMSMWTARRYLGRVFRTAFLGTKEEDESREAMSYRAAILGTVAGMLFMGGFCHRMGMSWWVITAFIVLYFTFAVVISRIRAELGFPIHDMASMSPVFPIAAAAGTANVPRQDLVCLSLFYWFTRTYASHPAPHQIESFKLCERTNTPARQMFVALLIAGSLAMPIGFWMLLHNYYHYGAATARMEMWALGFGRECWTRCTAWIQDQYGPNVIGMGFVGLGFAVSMLLGWLRTRLVWFPLHPLAYTVSNSWGAAQLWMPLLIGSTAKFLILRFGGMRAYGRALPFFLGLILGEITVGSLWTLVGIALGIPTYDFWPGK